MNAVSSQLRPGSGRQRTSFATGYRVVIEVNSRGGAAVERKTIYRRCRHEAAARQSASYVNDFVRLVEIAPLSESEWEAREK
jgi:hypothetical protein